MAEEDEEEEEEKEEEKKEEEEEEMKTHQPLCMVTHLSDGVVVRVQVSHLQLCNPILEPFTIAQQLNTQHLVGWWWWWK